MYRTSPPERLNLFNFGNTSVSRLPIFAAVAIIVLAILALLITRQIIFFDDHLQTIVFLLIVLFGYGIGSWILLGYVKRVSSELRKKSSFINKMHLSVTIIQFSLLGILLFIIYDNATNCPNFFNFCMSARIESVFVNAIASVSASVILGLFSLKFFLWYKAGNKSNVMILLFGLATTALSMSILVDAIDKILLQQVIEEKSPEGTPTESSFLYKVDEKLGGQIQYKVANSDTITYYVVPTELLPLHKFLIYLGSDPRYVIVWISVFVLLHQYYQRIGQKILKFPLKYLILLVIPLALYLIGSGLIFSLPNDDIYRFYQRIIFRSGSIGSSLLFGLAFYIIARNVQSIKVKDYLTITAIGISSVGIAYSISALQQTFGAAGHSLVLLFSYLFGMGIYSCAIFLSQDAKLRKSIRITALEQSKSLVNIGAIQLKQEIERKVLGIAKHQEETLTEQTGVRSSLTEGEMKQYLLSVLKDVKVLQRYEAILEKEKEIIRESNVFFACIRLYSILSTYNNYFEIYKDIMNKYRNGEHKGIRWVTTVDNNNLYLIKEFLNIGVKIRHVKNMPPIDFAVSDREMVTFVGGIVTINNSSKPSADIDTLQNLLVSNEPAYLDHFISFFEELWNNGIEARDRIKVIEQGLEPEFLEVLKDSKKSSEILVDIVGSIRKEGLFLLPEDKAMIRLDKLGDIIDQLINASIKGAIIKIICPITEINLHIVRKIEQYAPQIEILNGNNSPVGMVIADNAKCFRAELSEPNAENFSEAIGFTIYSNSKQSVNSFKSMFELLWKERVLVEELKKADIMQKEFINVAAHELKNPIQPILGLTEHLANKIKDKGQKELLDAVIRNAKKLKKLSENILDVTRIEGNSFVLDKQRFDLNELILNIVNDFSNQKNDVKSIKFEYDPLSDDGFEVYGDSDRIGQVISNLIENSVKFISGEGRISITAEKKKSNIASDKNDMVVVNVKDTGAGIHHEIIPLLFSKFATRSTTGTGLGLYISKNIVEAHGGKIWAQNNEGGNGGATFSFSFPFLNLKALEIHQYQKGNG